MHYPRKIVVRKRLLVRFRFRVRVMIIVRSWLGLVLGLGLGLPKKGSHSFFKTIVVHFKTIVLCVHTS